MAHYQFTPAAGRAIEAAARWTGGGSPAEVAPVELLLGLLAESESRAAEMLAGRGIDTTAVLSRWPELKAEGRSQKAEASDDQEAAAFSIELQTALAAAAERLSDFPRPLEFATEHLLLGLVAAGDELADWLAERGFATGALTDEICRLYGYGGNGEIEGSGDPKGARVPPEADVPQGSVTPEGSGFRVPPETDVPQGSGDVLRSTDSVGSATEGVPYRTPPRQSQTPVLRLIDAAANRAREGLRVVEDFVRFVWDDRHLMTELKHLRHELAAALAKLPGDELLASRDTLGDVGTAVSTASEAARPDVSSVITANFKRLQEALRSIEEFGKVLGPAMGADIERIRYRTYTLERAVSATSLGLKHLADARLYVLIDGRDGLDAFTTLVRELVSAGVDVLQLRDKQLADRELLDRAHRLRELTADTPTLFIMNDRPDLAALSRADGVHVGQEELSVSACRAIVGPRALIGVSTHSLDQARQAVLDGANYIGVGPTFASRTKRFDGHALRGIELLKAVQAEIRLPAFAIGGIDDRNLAHVLSVGFTRVAVSGALLSADSPGDAARKMLDAVSSGSNGSRSPSR